jgi:polyisoprenoid-binding protein YceI
MNAISLIFFLLPGFPHTLINPVLWDGSYKIDIAHSQVKWQADYVLGKGHEGTLKLSQGTLFISNGDKTLRGDFTIDMNTLANTDQKEERSRRDLEEHLKSDDFFSVNRFPTSAFSITGSQLVSPGNYTVSGYLAIKGFINPVAFPVKIVFGDSLKAKAEFVINRTKWGITHQSKSFFDDLKDGAIGDEIKIQIDLAFHKVN